MANCTYQGRIESPRGMVFSSGLFVVIAGTVAGSALCLLAVFGTPQTILPETARWVLVAMLYGVRFCWCDSKRVVEFARHETLDAGGLVRDRASMFRIRCADGLVCRQWSDQ